MSEVLLVIAFVVVAALGAFGASRVSVERARRKWDRREIAHAQEMADQERRKRDLPKHCRNCGSALVTVVQSVYYDESTGQGHKARWFACPAATGNPDGVGTLNDCGDAYLYTPYSFGSSRYHACDGAA
jgi:hypothetical protein